MKRFTIIICAILITACGSRTLPAIKTYEDLAAAYKAAHDAKDISRIGDLIYWGSITGKDRSATLEGIKRNTFLYDTVTETKITDAEKDIKLENDIHRFPFAPEKNLEVIFSPVKSKGVEVDRSTNYYLAMKDGKPYIILRSEPVKK
jgi:hypothetical protein